MKGLLCIPEMAVAILRDVGPKTMTRRVIVPQPPHTTAGFELQDDGLWHPYEWIHGRQAPADAAVRCDYKISECRCLLTTWAVAKQFDDRKPLELSARIAQCRLWHAGLGAPKPEWAGKSRPGRFLPNHLRPLMPVVEIVSVRAERVQDITPNDCRAEGMTAKNNDIGVRYAFGQLWNSINEKRGYGWYVNPWVWVIGFKRITNLP